MRELSIFGQGVYGDSPVITRQRRLNCFYHIKQDKDKHATVLRGTPGSLAWITLASSLIRGYWVAGGLLYVVAGNTLYSVTTLGSFIPLGSLSTNSGYVGMSDNGLQLLLVDGVLGYCYTIVTGSYNQAALNAAGAFGVIGDSNFPNGATTATFMNGYSVANVANSKQFRVSASYDITLWTNSASLATFGTKDDFSDPLIAVDAVNGVLIPWGSGSFENWQNVGTSPMPFARIVGSTQTIGLAAVQSRALFNNTIVFLGAPKEGGVQVMAINGYTAIRISDDDIEDIITKFPVVSDAVALVYNSHGHKMYQLTFPSAGRTFVYDANTSFWQEAQTGLGVQSRHFANLGIVFNTKNYVSDSMSGTIYQLSDTTYTDNGAAIKRQLVSRHVHQDGNEFGMADLFLDMETGSVPVNVAEPHLILQVSRDNGRTFGIEKPKSMGAVGQYMKRVIWKNLGMARDFVLQFTTTDPVPFVVVHASASLYNIEGGQNARIPGQ